MAILRTLLSQYRYDPLDRLVACSPVNLDPQQRFYCKSRLATEIQGAITHSFFQSDDWRMAQQRRQGADREATLLATDQQGSVLQAVDGVQRQAMAYSPYGHRTPGSGLLSLLGFSGEQPDPVTGHYLLGNGYRAFNPVLMRFNSPDSLSPFGKGGINAYRYCEGDPVNQLDPTGHIPGMMSLFKGLGNLTAQRPRGGAQRGVYVTVHGVDINPPTKPGYFFDIVSNPTDKFPANDLERLFQSLEAQRIFPGRENLSGLRNMNADLVGRSNAIMKREKFLVETYNADRMISYSRINKAARVHVVPLRKEYQELRASFYRKFKELDSLIGGWRLPDSGRPPLHPRVRNDPRWFIRTLEDVIFDMRVD
ncbi:RHS repeat-associated core domain-containing protein [Pseudomonas sp. RHF3.3-3]|uniref:RHS repeat-associated core domain-containing protein n=1 Tax=Pseudomonas sp. RHF3.3-3 TaxID=3396624 RepID=UPI003A863FDA